MQNRFNSYLSIAHKLIESYKGAIPFAAFLKNYFSQNKKHGSTDRKQISHLCYCYYRIGNALKTLNFNESIKIAYFLCNSTPKEFAFLFDESYLSNWSEDVNLRLVFISKYYTKFELEHIFNLQDLVSIDHKNSFIKSHLTQPDLFIRIRPSYETIVKDKLTKNQIAFKEIASSCLVVTNGSKINEVLKVNKEVVIQDYNSQQIGILINVVKDNLKQPISVWDCCAASGGKSILAKDILGEIQLTVSDVRASIIANLKKRFDEAGINKYQSLVADISKPTIIRQKFDFVICDAPCSGSGTWARTPEQLYFFKEAKVNEFVSLQKNIATNAVNYLKKEGYFLYITCSVFKQENEEIVDYLLAASNLKLVEKRYFEGFEMKADTMFAALLKKVD
jgi:16S rRNA (cytosine967-C5)-methyltransferase